MQIVATDLNQPMIDHAKSKPGVERVTFRQADALELPFPDSQYSSACVITLVSVPAYGNGAGAGV